MDEIKLPPFFYFSILAIFRQKREIKNNFFRKLSDLGGWVFQ
jgi:hypothetical protein